MYGTAVQRANEHKGTLPVARSHMATADGQTVRVMRTTLHRRPCTARNNRGPRLAPSLAIPQIPTAQSGTRNKWTGEGSCGLVIGLRLCPGVALISVPDLPHRRSRCGGAQARGSQWASTPAHHKRQRRARGPCASSRQMCFHVAHQQATGHRSRPKASGHDVALVWVNRVEPARTVRSLAELRATRKQTAHHQLAL